MEQQLADEKTVRKHTSNDLTLQRRNSKQAGKDFEEREAELREKEEEAREREQETIEKKRQVEEKLAQAEEKLQKAYAGTEDIKGQKAKRDTEYL